MKSISPLTVPRKSLTWNWTKKSSTTLLQRDDQGDPQRLKTRVLRAVLFFYSTVVFFFA